MLTRGASDGYDAQRLSATRIQLAATIALLGDAHTALVEARQALPWLKATMAWPRWGDEWIPVAVCCGQHAVAMQLLGHFEGQTGPFDSTEGGRRLQRSSEAACGARQVAAWMAAGRSLDTESALRLCEQLAGSSTVASRNAG